MNNDEIENLKRRLYRRGEVFKERKFISPLSPRQTEAKTSWEEPSSESREGHLIMPEKPGSSLRKKIIIGAVIVFALALSGAATYFLFLGGTNIISSQNIDIKLEGPTSVKGGEPNNWQVLITNKNKTNLELADLYIEYPDGSKPLSGSFSGPNNLSETRSIGEIKAGETVSEQIGVYLFGEQDTDKIFKFNLEYRPQGSNAILAKGQEESIRLLQSPIGVSLIIPGEVNAGEEFTLEADIISNAQTLIKDVNFAIDYPAGFQYVSSDLKPVSGNNIWKLGDLESNTKRVIKITGLLQGQDLMELSFRASAGPLDERERLSPTALPPRLRF